MAIKLQFQSQLSDNSIRQFNPVVLSPFAVLTGVNGSGKTHLLKAIAAGNVAVEGTTPADISYFSYLNFQAPNSGALTSQQIEGQGNAVWSQLTGKAGSKTNWISHFANICRQHLGTDDSELLYESLWHDQKWKALDTSERAKVTACREAFKQQFNTPHFRQIPHFASVIKLICKLRKPLDRMTDREFRDLFVPATNQQDSHLAGSLGVVFTKYKVNQFLWAHEQFERTRKPVTIEALYQQFHQLHSQPWDVMNTILQQIHAYASESGVFDFKITDPSSDLLYMDTWHQYSFVPQLVDKQHGEPRAFSALSSGEQVLLSLAISIFESRDDFHMPDLLLLDEIDASLHPSMSRALLQTLQHVFVDNGTKVLLATHSPSTVALAPEDSVFVVNKGPVPNKIEPVVPKEAIEVLTEGYATLEEGLSIFNEISKHDCCILTEGRNANHIRKALELFGVTGIEVAAGVEAITGWKQLKTLYQFFMATSHKTNVLFVWDNDCHDKCGALHERANTYRFVLPCNPQNTIASTGIENMYPVDLFLNFQVKTVSSRGVESVTFDYERKNDFERHVLATATRENFATYAALIEKIEAVRSAHQVSAD